MNKRMIGLFVGGLLAVTALGVAINTGSGSAAEKNAAQPPAAMQGMMQNGQMGTMDPQMMNSPEMQKQCLDMLKNPDMQKGMKEMMKQPETQAMMKQMLASDPEIRQMIYALVNAAEASTEAGDQTPPNSGSSSTSETEDHSAHHAS